MADPNVQHQVSNNQSNFFSDAMAFRAQNVGNILHEYHLKAIQILENGFHFYGTFVAR
jgi:hypothetical protein